MPAKALRSGSKAIVPDFGRAFDDPIPLPRGRQLITLRDAAEYITRLPKAEHDTAPWQAAMEALLLVAELGGPTMFARIGVMRALNRHHVRQFNPDAKIIIGDGGSSRGIGEACDLAGQCHDCDLASSPARASHNAAFR